MKFEEALALMREGRKVRRRCWPEECYLFLKSDTLHNEYGYFQEILTHCIFLHDWELYGEKEQLIDVSQEYIIINKLKELEERISLLEKKQYNVSTVIEVV